MTILVSLMLLVFLTIAALAMSRNSFREIVTSGTTRQGVMVRNLADSGLEWGILWADRVHNVAPVGTGAQMQTLMKTLLTGGTIQTGAIYGSAYDVGTLSPYTAFPSSPSDPIIPSVAQPNISSQGFSLSMTLMGKMASAGSSTDTSRANKTAPGGGDRSLDPDLWCIRSDAQLSYGSLTFIHSKETWLTTPMK